MKNRSLTELLNLSFSVIMILLTISGAIVFAFTDLFQDRAYGTKRYVLAVTFFAYAVYRTYRIYKLFKPNYTVEGEE